MTTDRVAIVDSRQAELQKELDKVDWSKFVRYGYVKIKVQDGKAKLQSNEETFPSK